MFIFCGTSFFFKTKVRLLTSFCRWFVSFLLFFFCSYVLHTSGRCFYHFLYRAYLVLTLLLVEGQMVIKVKSTLSMPFGFCLIIVVGNLTLSPLFILCMDYIIRYLTNFQLCKIVIKCLRGHLKDTNEFCFGVKKCRPKININ